MKKFSLINFLAFTFWVPIYSQINPWGGESSIGECDLETNCSWLHLDTSAANIWQLGWTSKPFFGDAHSLPNACMTDSLNPYPANANSWFEVRLPAGNSGIIFSFTHKYQIDSARDVGTILCSYDHGLNWNNVMDDSAVHNPIEFNTENMYTLNDTIPGGTPGFTGTDSTWKRSRIQWTWVFPVAGPGFGPFVPDTLFLRFLYLSDSTSDSLDGWIIDDLELGTVDYGIPISDPWLLSMVKVYPNPFSEKLELDIDESVRGNFRFELMDLKGRTVYHQIFEAGGNHQLNTSSLEPGFYFSRVMDEKGRIAWGKLVK